MTVRPRDHATSARPALWERDLPVGRDRTTRLTADEIATAAFGIAEAENLLATSVKRVANRLGIPAPRLEQYLPDREAVFDLMLDRALSEVELPAEDSVLDWRAQVELISDATYRAVLRHPWLVELIGGRPATGPSGLRYVERAIAAMRGSGMDVNDAALCLNAVLAFVAGSVRAQASKAAERAGADATYLAGVVADGPYPQLRLLFAEGGAVTADESFARGLAYLLDGAAARFACDLVVAGSSAISS